MKKSIILMIVGTVFLAIGIFLFFYPEASSIAIIGGADGPTAIYITSFFHFLLEYGSIIVGVILLSIAVFLLIRSKRTNK